jgi:predicted acyltransferase
MAKLLVLTYVGDQRTQAFLFERVFAPLAAAVNASLIYALSYVVLWFALTWVMARAGLRLRV